jgi:hypothetical protein
MPDTEKLLVHIRSIWPDPSELLPLTDDRYRALPLCVIDAVYSIGVRYESTERTVAEFCKWAGWGWQDERTIREFLDSIRDYAGKWESLAVGVFKNRQRTSSRSGILKAEAEYHFAKRFEKPASILSGISQKPVPMFVCWLRIAAIPGQGSGISFKYFLMLAGYDGIVKPDRMIGRFVAEALGLHSVKVDMAEALVLSAYQILRVEVPGLTAAMLDYRIWSHQRNAQAKTARAAKPACR